MIDVFYVKDRAGRTVVARFLAYGGKCIRDPNVENARDVAIFTDAEGETVLSNGNPDAYFIVPYDYTIEKAVMFSNMIAATGLLNGTTTAYGAMALSFKPNGSQDLQRTYPGSDGINPGDFVPAFTDSASFHFGFVATYSGIGENMALRGGGILNRYNARHNKKIDTSGIYGNNPHNVKSIHAGAMFARTLMARSRIHLSDVNRDVLPIHVPYLR